MLIKQNDRIYLTCEESGQGLALIDQKRKTRWELDPQSLVFGKSVENPWGNLDSQQSLLPQKAKSLDDAAIAITYKAGAVILEMRLRLVDDYIEISLPKIDDEEIGHVSLPGSFQPVGESLSLLLPIMTGEKGIGLIVLDNFNTPGAFRPEDEALMLSLSQQVALSLENVRLVHAMTERAGQLEALNEISTAMTSSPFS